VRAGREKLGLVVEIGDRADAIYAAAEKLVTDHRAAQEAKAAHAAPPHAPPPGDPTPS
jgi:hypothetical protein